MKHSTTSRKHCLQLASVASVFRFTTAVWETATFGRVGKGALLMLLVGLSSCRNAAPRSHSNDQNQVTILGMLSGQRQELLETVVLAPFEAETGIEVIYESTESFNSLLDMRIGVLNQPHLALIPQPGLIADYVDDDLLVPVTDFIDERTLRQAYPDNWLDIVTVDDMPYAVWYEVAVKSLVWYRPSAFEVNGYNIPTSWDAMVALSDRIVADGGTPWCLGLESGGATGWPATDWIEDILLRTAGPEAYRQWVSHELPFNSPLVINAFDEFSQILRKPKYIYGGAEKSAEIPYGEASLGLFGEQPNCYMHRQASFVRSFFPPDTVARVDYDVFPLPAIDQKFGLPILVSGDAVVMFRDTPAAREVMAYLASAEAHKLAAEGGNFISPHKQVPLNTYPNAVNQTIAQILADADTISFDGSDMMPGYIGTDIFWEEMVAFAKGKSAEDVAKEIDNSWPNN